MLLFYVFLSSSFYQTSTLLCVSWRSSTEPSVMWKWKKGKDDEENLFIDCLQQNSKREVGSDEVETWSLQRQSQMRFCLGFGSHHQTTHPWFDAFLSFWWSHHDMMGCQKYYLEDHIFFGKNEWEDDNHNDDDLNGYTHENKSKKSIRKGRVTRHSEGCNKHHLLLFPISPPPVSLALQNIW